VFEKNKYNLEIIRMKITISKIHKEFGIKWKRTG